MKVFKAQNKLEQASRLFTEAGLDLEAMLGARDDKALSAHISELAEDVESTTIDDLLTQTGIEASEEQTAAEAITASLKGKAELENQLTYLTESLKESGIELVDGKSVKEILEERISIAAQEQLSKLGHEPVNDDVTDNPDEPQANKTVVEKWQAITDPGEKTTFYRKNRDKIISSFTKV